MEQVTANLSGKVRRESLYGKNFLVAPLSLLVPGVLNGSKGPLLYTNEDTAASVERWPNIPIVVNHPSVDGKPVSARSPAVLNKSGIGFVFNPTMNGGLKAEGWFDEDQTKKVDSRVWNALVNGQRMELSTGLFTSDEPAEDGATFNGIEYKATARNHRPDHLAVLPDEIGACSIQDGCGLNVNKDGIKTAESTNTGDSQMAKLTDAERSQLVDSIVANCDCWKDDDKETLNTMDDRALTAINGGIESGKKVKELEETIAANSKKKDPPADPPKKQDPPPTTNTTTQPQKLSAEQWYDQAPPEVQEAVRNSMNIVEAEKARIIDQLVANAADDTVKEAARQVYNGMKLDQLKAIAGTVPQKTSDNPFAPNYAGASLPAVNSQSDEIDRDDILTIPTINFEELAKERDNMQFA